MFCVVCGFSSDLMVSGCVCELCKSGATLSLEQLETYVPSVCGSDDCYLDGEGMPNFDDMDCGHDQEFEQIFPFAF